MLAARKEKEIFRKTLVSLILLAFPKITKSYILDSQDPQFQKCSLLVDKKCCYDHPWADWACSPNQECDDDNICRCAPGFVPEHQWSDVCVRDDRVFPDDIHTFGRKPHAPKKENCTNISWKGDKSCDDENNNEGCDFDGGDCCGPNVDKTYCTECECKSVEGRKVLFNDNLPCSEQYDYPCSNGKCISPELICDFFNDCGDLSDEEYCPGRTKCSPEFSDVPCCINGKCPAHIVGSNRECDHYGYCGCKPYHEGGFFGASDCEYYGE